MDKQSRSAKTQLISFVSIFIAASIIVGVASFRIYGENNTGVKTFAGDEPWYSESKYMWQYIVDKIYVPIYIFEKFGAEITTSSNSIMIAIGSKYISFYTEDNRFAYTPEDKEFYLKTYWMVHHTLSVPVRFVCEYFGLKFETYTDSTGLESNTLAIRISDGKSKYTIKDLIKMYNPSLIATETTVIQSDTAETTAEQTARAYLIYLTFEDAPNKYTGQILDLLADYGYKATFFLNGDALEDNAELVRRIIAEGHSLGLHTMTRSSSYFAKDIQNFIGELRQENDVLYRLFRVTSRLVRAPDGSRTSSFVISAEEGALIDSLGYVIWDYNVDTYDTAGYNAERVADNAINGIVKYEVPVLRFHSTEVTVTALKTVLDYIKSHSDQFQVSAITPAANNISFVG